MRGYHEFQFHGADNHMFCYCHKSERDHMQMIYWLARELVEVWRFTKIIKGPGSDLVKVK